MNFTNVIEGMGISILSRALESNTTLTTLDLKCLFHTVLQSFISFTFFNIKNEDNRINDVGATALSEALKSNTTLTELNLASLSFGLLFKHQKRIIFLL